MDSNLSESVTIADKCQICERGTDEVIFLDCGHLVCARCLYRSFDPNVTVSKLTEQIFKCSKCQATTRITQKNKTVIEAFMLAVTPCTTNRDEVITESPNMITSGKESEVQKASWGKETPNSTGRNFQSFLSIKENILRKIGDLLEVLNKTKELDMNEGTMVAFNTCSVIVSSLTNLLMHSQGGSKRENQPFLSQEMWHSENDSKVFASSSEEFAWLRPKESEPGASNDGKFFRFGKEYNNGAYGPSQRNGNNSTGLFKKEKPREFAQEQHLEERFEQKGLYPEETEHPQNYRWSVPYEERPMTSSQKYIESSQFRTVPYAGIQNIQWGSPLLSQRGLVYKSQDREEAMRSFKTKMILKEQRKKETDLEMKRFILLRTSPVRNSKPLALHKKSSKTKASFQCLSSI